MKEQSYASHTRVVPGFHFVTLGILAVNLLWSLYRLFRPYEEGSPVFDRILAVLVAGGILGLAYYARVFPLAVQDRVIVNEMRARLAAALPPDLHPRLGELRRRQLIALRFAGDDELPEITRQVLDGKLTRGDEIKRAVRSWRADHLRA